MCADGRIPNAASLPTDLDYSVHTCKKTVS